MDIYAYNLTTEEETRITTDEERDTAFLLPLIADDLVVWGGTESRFYGYRLGTEDAEAFSLTSYESLMVGCPAVCGIHFSAGGSMTLIYGARPHYDLSDRALVWSEEEREDIRDIVAFDLERDTRMRITDDSPAQGWPTTAGSLIVWADERNDAGDIYAYDLDTEEEFAIATAPLTQTMPSTDGSLVVWLDKRDENDDIYGYNLETQTEFPIVTSPANRSMPTVRGNFVIWMEEHNEDWDIYGYDLLVGEEFPIVTKDGWQGNPRIWDNIVVWTDKRDEDNQDIYGATLEY
jgi:beta propeller repeat protein